LIRLTVWPQCTDVTDRQTGQDRQRTDSLGRTVLQTVAKIMSKVDTQQLCIAHSINVGLWESER